MSLSYVTSETAECRCEMRLDCIKEWEVSVFTQSLIVSSCVLILRLARVWLHILYGLH